MQYVRNCWYVAGWAREFDRSLRRITMLEQDIVVYRSEAGEVIALEDRCPHKLLPLSKGKLIGDTVQCGYHGLTFDCSGSCVRVPGQDNIPETAKVHSYPVLERHDIVWIWMGDPAKADTSKVFDLPQFTDPAWAAHQGDALYLKSNYLNVADNLCDPAHVSFVHPTTLGNAASEDVGVQTEKRDDGVIVTWRWIRDAPPVGFFKKFGNFSGHVDRWHYYYLHAPSIAVIDFGSGDVTQKLTDASRNDGVRIFALHFLTPIDATTTIDRWMHIRNTATDDDGVGDQMDELFRIAFNEDKEILEAIQEEELKPNEKRPVRLAIDLGPNLYHKTVQSMIEAEAS